MTAARPPVPAVVVCGPPAAGKSTLARSLARALAATLLDQDVLTGPLTEVVLTLLGTEDLDGATAKQATRAARYETLLAVAEDNLHVGGPVVLVAPFSNERRDPAAWGRLRERLGRAGGSATLVWLRLDGDELLRRMAARSAGRDAPKLADGAAYVASVDLAPPVVAHLAVDAAQPTATQCELVLGQLRDA